LGETDLDRKAYKIDSDGQKSQLQPQSEQTAQKLKVVGSRSHQSPEIKGFIEALGKDSELVAMGSSLKLCLVASGDAHLYPRLGPTSEWDTAAAHAVVKAAGGKVTLMEKKVTQQSPSGHTPSELWQDSKIELQYNQKESVLNPYFLVSA
jgi:3'(2'), 5'-bisphosphate nucleotidase